jgi:hypothetical protein
MMHNPYEPCLRVVASTWGGTATKVDLFRRVVCWLFMLLGVLLIVLSLLFIVGNGYSWLDGKQAVQVKTLMLFAVISLGAIPAVVGFALQHYSRRNLHSRVI